MIIAVVNEKGGVGKSTLAAHLAIWLHEQGKRVALLDTDGQQSTSRWVTAAEPGITVEWKTKSDDILESGPNLAESHDVVICDGPANLSEGTRALLLIADAAIVPMGPSFLEVEATQSTIRILKNAQKVRSGGVPHPILVVNRTRDQRFKLTQDILEAAPQLGLPMAKGTIAYRDAVADAPGQRTVLWRMGKGAKKAADELVSILEEVLNYVADKTKHPHLAQRRAEAVSGDGASAPGSIDTDNRSTADAGTTAG